MAGVSVRACQQGGSTDGRNVADRVAVCGRQRRAKPRDRRRSLSRLAPDVIICLGFGHNGGDEARDLIDPDGIRCAVNEPVEQGLRRKPGAARGQRHRT